MRCDRGSPALTPAKGKVTFQLCVDIRRIVLGIELIAAYSPEARGRSERLFRTLQDRLPKELALAGIRFGISAAEPGTAFVPFIGTHLTDILCIQEMRTVGNDNTVRYEGRILKIPQDTHRKRARA